MRVSDDRPLEAMPPPPPSDTRPHDLAGCHARHESRYRDVPSFGCLDSCACRCHGPWALAVDEPPEGAAQ